MGLTDTSEILLRGMHAALSCWKQKHGGEQHPLYWVLRLKLADNQLANGQLVEDVVPTIPDSIRDDSVERFKTGRRYWDDIRYATLEPVTQLWGTIVNTARVVAGSDRATEGQKKVFGYPAESLHLFFRAARERMEVADELYHAYKAMPAPECQALAALLNVHVDAPLDVDTMCRLVRLLDHEGPMTDEEQDDLSSISNTSLVSATFTGLRGNA